MHRTCPLLIAAILFPLVLSASTSVSGATPGPLPPEADRILAREIFKQMIETNTTHTQGSTTLAMAIRERLQAAGFLASDLALVTPTEHPAKGNLIVRMHGSGKAKPVLFLGHLDVVEARREDWSVDPFSFTEQEGWIYGRGTIDMKNGDAAMVESLVRLKREGFRPERDLIVALTADEEAGGDANGPAFLLKEHRELIDAAFAVNLDGGGGVYRNGQRAYLEFGTSEKTYFTYTAETTGPGGHGSLPRPENPIYTLADALARLERFQFPVMLTATTHASFDARAELPQRAESADMHAVAKTPTDLAAAERLSRNVYFNAQLHTTCTATLISGGHAENALPQRARATLQCRMMPGDSEANVRATLVRVLADPRITLTLDAPPIVSPESAPTAEMLKRVADVAHSMWPGVPIVPTMATGFSDDRQTRNAGIPSYDLSGTWMDADEDRAHGRDERIGAREFDESVEYTWRLMKRMSRAE